MILGKRVELAEHLTAFMIPEFMIKMRSIQLNSNGKPDTAKLPVVMKAGALYTHPMFPKHGVAKAVVNWLIEQAKQEEITKIYLETSDKARLLYSSLSFSDMKGYMKLER